jgi:hypothetical protein
VKEASVEKLAFRDCKEVRVILVPREYKESKVILAPKVKKVRKVIQVFKVLLVPGVRQEQMEFKVKLALVVKRVTLVLKEKRERKVILE